MPTQDPVSHFLLVWAKHHLFQLPGLLHWEVKQFLCCNFHEEGVENPDLLRVRLPDERGLFPEALSYLWRERRMEVCLSFLLICTEALGSAGFRGPHLECWSRAGA